MAKGKQTAKKIKETHWRGNLGAQYILGAPNLPHPPEKGMVTHSTPVLLPGEFRGQIKKAERKEVRKLQKKWESYTVEQF